jgi:hypothetical protein
LDSSAGLWDSGNMAVSYHMFDFVVLLLVRELLERLDLSWLHKSWRTLTGISSGNSLRLIILQWRKYLSFWIVQSFRAVMRV